MAPFKSPLLALHAIDTVRRLHLRRPEAQAHRGARVSGRCCSLMTQISCTRSRASRRFRCTGRRSPSLPATRTARSRGRAGPPIRGRGPLARGRTRRRGAASSQRSARPTPSSSREIPPEDSARLGAALGRVVDDLPDGGRALVVGHSPTNEAAILGLTGEVVAPLGKGAGVVLVATDDGYEVGAA
jgi:hypothetical protein